MDRRSLADFLRRRRSGLTPGDVGLPAGVRRRTPGLRRDEVAALANMSTDYYTRLEQARGPHPSSSMLAALARALRLNGDERDHLFHLAGTPPPLQHGIGTHISPGLLYLLDRLVDTPAFVINDLNDCLMQNPMSVAVSGDVVSRPVRQRNHTRTWFTNTESRLRFPEQDWPKHSRTHVADLRATFGARGADSDVRELVEELLAVSPEFAELWADHEVAVRRADAKRIVHPEVGLLDLLCEHLTSAPGGQTLVMLFPRPGTDAREKLDLLRVIGTQDLTTAR